MIWLEILKIVLAGGLLGYVVGMLIVKRPYYINRVRPKFWMRIAKKMDIKDWAKLIGASSFFIILAYFVITYSGDFIGRFWALYSPEEYVFSQIETASPLLLLIMATLIPVIEEWVFRGILQEELSRRLRSRVAGLVLAALIFALFHLSNPGTYPAAVAPLFLGGLIFGICYIRTGLAGAILTHAAYNFILVLPAVLGI
ncbi:MAG: CPBP family intramembrane metalloprotease [Candidatus Hadarchaeum sp.]|nr:CPBP family intramembrane metalloprotease [Candidatus Hadarchaeum sp.]